jgi:hypothetical protein
VLAALSTLSTLSTLSALSAFLPALSGLLALLTGLLLAASALLAALLLLTRLLLPAATLLTTLIGIAHDRSCCEVSPDRVQRPTLADGSWELAAPHSITSPHAAAVDSARGRLHVMVERLGKSIIIRPADPRIPQIIEELANLLVASGAGAIGT